MMSLDVYLTLQEPGGSGPLQAIFIRRDGSNVEITREEWDSLYPGVEPVMASINGDCDATEAYSANITHNLNKMAEQAGIYEPLWRPEEIGITKAAQLVQPLTEGLGRLKSGRVKFEQFNPSNGWGNYDGLVRFVENYLAACVANPDADVRVSR